MNLYVHRSHLTPSSYEGVKTSVRIRTPHPLLKTRLVRIVMEDCPDQRIGEKGGVYRY